LTGHGHGAQLPAMHKPDKRDTPLADRFVVVLVETQDLVNIAGSVRAMLNMGLARLRLVKPEEAFDPRRVAGIAHGAEPLIERVEFYDTLDDAVRDASLVVGTSARRRTAAYVWHAPRAAADELIAWPATAAQPIALVFGREDAGLTNDELDRCDRLLVVPTNPRHPSLNLAQAVLLIGYELWLAGGRSRPLPVPKRKSVLATSEDLRLLFDDLRRMLDAIEFFKARNEEAVLRTARAVIRRSRPTQRESKLLRAIAIETRKFLKRKLADTGPAQADQGSD
jgi:TrmH family RNA methyltransferase